MADAKEGGRVIIAKINEALEPFMDICFKWKLNKLVKARKEVKEDKFRILVEAENDITPPVRDMLQVFERGHLPIFSHSTPKGSPAYGKTVPKKI